MNCEQRMDDMQRFVDHDLTPVEEVGLLAHIKQCPDCAASFEQLQRLSAELSLLPMVTPPFSIVDSIMPMLAELDAQQAANHISIVSKSSKKALFSWKAAAGFAAAAAVFIIVIVNFSNLSTSSKSDASDMLIANTASEARAGIGVADSGKGIEGTITEAPMAAVEGAAPEAEDKLMTKKSDKVQKEQSSYEIQDNSTNAVADNGLMKRSNDSLPQAYVQPSPQPKLLFGAEVNTEDTKKIQVTSSEQTPPTPVPTAAIPAASPAAAVAPLIGAAPDPSTQTLASDDGNFIGLIEHQIVQVQTLDGNRIYTSSIQWKDTDRIRLLLWQDNQRLTYEVTMEDGQVKRFIVDPILKTEQEQSETNLHL